MSKKGHNSAMTIRRKREKILVHLFFMHIPHIKFQEIISLTVFDHMQSVTDTQTDRQAQTNMPPLNFCEAGGIKRSLSNPYVPRFFIETYFSLNISGK